MIQPRFSFRSLMIVVTLVAIALYLMFGRPTVIAQRFVEAANNQDLEYARSHLSAIDGHCPYLAQKRFVSVHMEAKLLPREWSDLWRFRRRLNLIMTVQRTHESGIGAIHARVDAGILRLKEVAD